MSLPLRPQIRILSLASLLVLLVACSARGEDFMFRARVDGQTFEGKPLTWTDTEMIVLGRDGQIHDFNPKDAKESRKTGTHFFGYSMSEMKRELYREFGKESEITTTNHYIVVHPRGEKDKWAQRFEDLYRTFNHYFRVRGFRPTEPEFPLVAVVFRNQEEYIEAANASGAPFQPGTLGHYDPVTNRVYLYDITADDKSADWSQNASTIIHEATHQTAYNVGIHSRFTRAPRWLVEGLAMMFEARGVWDSANHPDKADRVNVERLRDFQAYLPRRAEGSLAQLIASDEPFRTAPLDSYAEAWAFSFYLSETHPHQYSDYLAKTAARPMFAKYTPEQRMADFQEVFGTDMRMIEKRFLSWIDEVR